MPNFKDKALKKARDLLQQRDIAFDTNSSESEESVKSEEYSHIPIANLDLSLENLTMEPQNQPNPLEEINNQLAQMMRAIEAIGLRQNEQEIRLNASSAQTVNEQEIRAHHSNARAPTLLGDPFRIPDPIKMLPTFSGNKKQLVSWIETAEKTLGLFEHLVDSQIFDIYLTAVINKIEGHAKDILCTNGNPKNFGDVKRILTESIGDKQELSTYNCQLWHNKMDGSVSKHYQKTKELVHNIKSLAKQNPKYNQHWDAINDFIDEYSLAAYVSGLQKPYFGYVQAAEPKNIENAYAFICKFTSNESNKNITQHMVQNKQEWKSKEPRQGNNSFIKPNPPKAEQPQRQDYRPHKPNRIEPLSEPMDTGSARSKLTLYKRQVNNTEIQQHDEHSDSDAENDQEEIDINFCLVQRNQTAT